MTAQSELIVATRLHLGHSLTPPTDLPQKIASFQRLCGSLQAPGVIALDAAPKIPGYDLHHAVQEECARQGSPLQILPVQPWGQFAPALNALVGHAAVRGFRYVLFASAETSAPPQALGQLLARVVEQPDTLVAGAVLPGHDYRAGPGRPLNGRTSPWNTLAVWNLSKLSLTGFQMVSEGLLTGPGQDNFAGIEEVVTTALLQRLFPGSCKSKLVKLEGVSWDLDFEDEKRRAWHEAKMESKLKRSLIQLELMGGLSGEVEHC